MPRRKTKSEFVIPLFGYDIKVSFMDENDGASSDCAGSYIPSTQEIQLNPCQSETGLEETLLHEVIEAINALCDLNLPHHAIQMLAVGLHQSLNGMKDFTGKEHRRRRKNSSQ